METGFGNSLNPVFYFLLFRFFILKKPVLFLFFIFLTDDCKGSKKFFCTGTVKKTEVLFLIKKGHRIITFYEKNFT